ncbi:MAG: MarR family transcriptional regulator [Hyphomonadaceae bacterium]
MKHTLADIPENAVTPAGRTEDDPALAETACFLRIVARTSRAVVAAYDPVLQPHGLTGHQYNLMTTLKNTGPLTVGELGIQLGMDPSGVPRAIRPLNEAGWVDVARGEDRRKRVLSITDAGQAVLDKAYPDWLAMQTRMVERVGSERWVNLMSDLDDVRRSANRMGRERPNTRR